MATDIAAVIEAAIKRVSTIRPADAATAAANVQTDLGAAGVQLIGDLPRAEPTGDPSRVIVDGAVFPRDLPTTELLAMARRHLALVALASTEPPAERIAALADAIDVAGRRARSSRDLARELARQGWTRASQ